MVNHGIPLEVLDKGIEGVRMVHEQDVDVQKEYYSWDHTKQVLFTSNRDFYHSKAANWRDTLYVNSGSSSEPDPAHELLPPICRYYTCFLFRIACIFSESLRLHCDLARPCESGHRE